MPRNYTSEYTEQCNLIEWCERFKGRIPELGLIFASNNGIRVSIGVAVKMKKAGMKKGVPDLFLPVPQYKGYAGLFVEMKVGSNTESDEQIEWRHALKARGYQVFTCYSWWEAATAILAYLGYEHLIDELVGIVEIPKTPRRRKQTAQAA